MRTVRYKIIKMILWIAGKLEDELGPEVEVYRVNDKVILPDHLSSDIISMRITFDEPVSPMRVIENLDGGSPIKNPLPDRTFILYEVL